MPRYSWEMPVKEEKFELFNQLTESRAFRSETELNNLDYKELTVLFYLYLVSLVLVSLHNQREVTRYARRTSAFNNFDKFRISVNDLYLLAFILLGNYKDYKYRETLEHKSRMSELDFKRFLAIVASSSSGLDFMENYFYGLERQIRMTDGIARNLRRSVINWPDLDENKRKKTIDTLIYQIKRISPRAEILSLLLDIK